MPPGHEINQVFAAVAVPKSACPIRPPAVALGVATKMYTVSDFMDRQFTSLHPDTPLHQAMDVLLDKGLIGATVVDGSGKLVGILSEKDCLKVLLQDAFHLAPDATVAHYMHQPERTIPSDTGIVEAAQIFLENTFRRMAVVDGGKLVGQVTRRDLLRGMRDIILKKK